MPCGCLSPPKAETLRGLRPHGEKEGCDCKDDGHTACSCKGHDADGPCQCPPPHPNGARDVRGPDSECAGSPPLDPPPVVVPRWSVFRCSPPSSDLRPWSSFIDCEVYAFLLSGTAHAAPWMEEPPQALELEPTGPAVGLVEARDQRRLDKVPAPIPDVGAAEDGVLDCAGSAVSARFSRVSACGGKQISQPASDGSGQFTPVSPDARGRGGGGVPWNKCTCQCFCDRLVANGSTRPGDPRSRLFKIDVDPEKPQDPFPWSTPPPLRDPRRPGAKELSTGGGEDGPNLPGDRAPGEPQRPQRAGSGLVVAPDAPPDEIFEGARCPWCGGIRGGSQTSPPAAVRPPVSHGAVEGLEPPAFAGATTHAKAAAPGSRSLGSGASSLGPPVHSVEIADSAVRMAGRDSLQGDRDGRGRVRGS